MKNRIIRLKGTALAILLYCNYSHAQSVAINSTGTAANTSSMLDISSGAGSNRGLLIPRVTSAQKTAMNPLPAAAQGLMVYQTDGVQGFYYNISTTTTPSWNYLSTTGTDWSVTGNSGTTAGTNFIGTTDAIDWVVKTNNTERMRVLSGGNVGINTTSPSYRLQVNDNGDIPFLLLNTTSTTNKRVRMQFGQNGTINWEVATDLGVNNGDNLYFYDRTTSTFGPVFLNTGYVGIGTTAPAVKLAVGGAGTNYYATDLWVENNAHIEGNETLLQGGRGRMRVGTAWNYVGLYSETSSTGVVNDLVLGASSGVVRVGPSSGSGQSLRWANSYLVDDQGGSMEIGGYNSIAGTGTPYMDFHCNSGYTRDYDYRMIVSKDANGPILTMNSYVGTTNYKFFNFSWIGAYDCYADVSAWRYYAQNTNSIYADVTNDLDLIDNIRPKSVLDPKSNKTILVNDPATMPSFLIQQHSDNADNYSFDVGATASFSLGAIRMLRKETKSQDEALEQRIERLEKLVEQLSGKTLGEIDYAAEATAYKGVEYFVIMDARVSKNSTITLKGLQNAEIVDQKDGSFAIRMSAPASSDVKFSYSGKF
ncbi:MAG: hypothetical protein ACJ77K_15495 [Bacteroidia bacterium]